MTEAPLPESALRPVYRDLFRSALAGPLRFFIPLAGTFFLYPLLLAKTSLAVLGLWSLLSTLVSYISMADVGFSLLLTREAGPGASLHDSQEARRNLQAARRAYGVLALLLLTVLLAIGPQLFSGLTAHYDPAALCQIAMVLVAASLLQLSSRLDAAILSARHDNFGVQSVLAIVPVFPFAASIGGAFIGLPIEGLALGALLSAAAQSLIFRFFLRMRHADWLAFAAPLPWSQTPSRLLALARRGRHLYAIALGFALREPLFRLILGVGLGPAAVGLYDIAMRVARTLRDLAASGFTALYPGMAHLHRCAARAEMTALITLCLLVLLAAGVLGLGLALLFAPEVYVFWLKTVPEGLLPATRLLVLANLLSLLNIPFWYLLQASHNERLGAIALWLQTAMVLLLVPAGAFLPLTLQGVLGYWVAGEAVMLLAILGFIHMRLDLSLISVLSPRLLGLFAAAAAFLFLAWFYPPAGLVPRLMLGMGYAALAGLFIYRPVADFRASGAKGAP